MLCGLIFIPIQFVLDAGPDAFALLRSFGVILSVSLTVFGYFVPKIYIDLVKHEVRDFFSFP